MNDIELQNIWQVYNQQLEESLQLNKKNAEEIAKMKVGSFLVSMKPLKIFAILVGIAWVGFIDRLIINLFSVASPFFLISAGVQVLLTKAALGIYLYQLILIYQTDISESIVKTQRRLASLKSTTLWVARILFLQLPVWTTFYLNQSIFERENLPYIVLNGLITLLFMYGALWLFFNIKYENREKKWFRMLFKGKEWEPVMNSLALLEEIKEFQKES